MGKPYFSPTVRIPIAYFAGLRAPTVPVKLLKLRAESNLGAEGRPIVTLPSSSPLHQTHV